MAALRTLTCALFLLGSVAGKAAAQFEDEEPQIVVGPMAGVSFSTLRGAGAGDADVRSGVIAGGFATFTFTPYFALQPQVLYVQKGANYKRDSTASATTGALALSYIEIPLLFQARYPIGTGRWPLVISAIAGPAIGINVACQNTVVAGSDIDCNEGTDTQLDPIQISNLDISAVFGIGLDFSHFAFQARYDYSFTGLYTYPNGSLYTVDIKNQAWELTLGYKIRIN